MKATQYLVESLRAEGIDRVFCVPGGLIDPFLPALSETEGVEAIVATHEGAAGYMADGYARASGRLGGALGNVWLRAREVGRARPP